MTSISGYAELMESGLAKPEDIPVFSGKIRKEAGRLISLINDIIELSLLDDGVSTKEFEPVSLGGTSQRILAALEISAKKVGVSLSFSGDEAMVFANPSMLFSECEIYISYIDMYLSIYDDCLSASCHEASCFSFVLNAKQQTKFLLFCNLLIDKQ